MKLFIAWTLHPLWRFFPKNGCVGGVGNICLKNGVVNEEGIIFEIGNWKNSVMIMIWLVVFRHDLFLPNGRIPSIFSVTPEYHLFDISFSTEFILYHKSLTMFLKVLNKLNFRVLTSTQNTFYYWLTPFCKINYEELLTAHHSSSEGRDVFVHQLLKLSNVLVVYLLHGCAFSCRWVG